MDLTRKLVDEIIARARATVFEFASPSNEERREIEFNSVTPGVVHKIVLQEGPDGKFTFTLFSRNVETTISYKIEYAIFQVQLGVTEIVDLRCVELICDNGAQLCTFVKSESATSCDIHLYGECYAHEA